MCTVLFLPLPTGYMLCSTRDENPHRATLEPQIYQDIQPAYLCPLDVEKKGTWIATNEAQYSLVLLNGGFQRHTPRTNYTLSRGAIIMKLLSVKNPIDFLKQLDLSETEPFTLIIKYEQDLIELVWTGTDKHFELLNSSQSYIWSSSTLYDDAAKKHRKKLFDQWLETKPALNWENIVHFFQSYSDPKNGFFMERSAILQTISMSMIFVEPQTTHFYYTDFKQSSLQHPKMVHLNTKNGI